MTTYPMHFTDNANSWLRIGQLARLYWPGLKIGFIIYATVPLCFVVLAAVISKLVGIPVYSWFEWVSPLLIFLGPVMLTRRDYRDISKQLPVTAAEKLGFLLLTFWIAIPMLVWISGTLGELFSGLVFGDDVMKQIEKFNQTTLMSLKNYGFSHTWANLALGITSNLSIISIVLYYVVSAKKNRTMAAFVSFLVVVLASCVFVSLIGAVIGFIEGYTGTASGMDDAKIVEAIARDTIWLSWMMIGVITAAGIFYLIKLYKRLRNSGF